MPLIIGRKRDSCAAQCVITRWNWTRTYARAQAIFRSFSRESKTERCQTAISGISNEFNKLVSVQGAVPSAFPIREGKRERARGKEGSLSLSLSLPFRAPPFLLVPFEKRKLRRRATGETEIERSNETPRGREGKPSGLLNSLMGFLQFVLRSEKKARGATSSGTQLKKGTRRALAQERAT